MSFKGSRINSSMLRRERILRVEAREAIPLPLNEQKVQEIVAADLPLVIEGGNATLAFQEDQIVLDGGKA